MEFSQSWKKVLLFNLNLQIGKKPEKDSSTTEWNSLGLMEMTLPV